MRARARVGAGLAPLVLVVALAAVGVVMARRAPDDLDPRLAWAPPSAACPLGCGEAGVDLLSLVSAGVLHALLLAVGVAAFGFVLGTPLGAGAAMARGRAESAVARACDLIQAFPTFLLALAVLSAVRSPTRMHLALVFSLTGWAPFARLALAEARVIRGAAFVEAAAALGAGPWRVLVRHVVPNLLGVVAIQLGASAAAIVVSEAALAFVGLGPKDGVSLGAVLDQGVAAMLRAPHVLVAGAAGLFCTSSALLLAARTLALAPTRGTDGRP